MSLRLKKIKKELKLIKNLELEMASLSNKELKGKTKFFKDKIAQGASLASIRIEAFAVVKEVIFRVLKKKLFDVQIMGALVLEQGQVAEMKTGEGKTLASIPAIYLNALKGEGVLVSTLNEYLAERDAVENGEVFNWLGLSVGINKKKLDTNAKREVYFKDITYSIHSEIGFDYLRDNMVLDIKQKVQRSFSFCLIDEIDSILIDEAKTPLLITGGAQTSSQIYLMVDTFVKNLKKADYEIDMESKTIQLTKLGMDKSNKYFKVKNFYNIENSELVHRTSNALRAHFLMHRDIDYIVKENKIEIIDAFTGRILEGRSYSDGLHQAIQAKEKVEIESEMQTLATITYQNLFRMFKKLCGMTGTAKTEEDEFIKIYNMRVICIPTNKPMVRIDHPDLVFTRKQHKYKALINCIIEKHQKGQPILVGTEELSESEKISNLLKKQNIPHQVLNAKQNAQEAHIIAKAGMYGAVTIATNMAGRGTDIKLVPKSIEAGGLYVMVTNKAESRRVDNQIRGRSGRQGDVGESKFFLSLEDTLISRFSSQKKLIKLFDHLGDKPIKTKQIVKVLNRAQVKIEGFNYDSRKNVLHFDDVIRQQRDLVYSQRDIIISHDDLYDFILRLIKSVIKDLVLNFDNFKSNDGSLEHKKLSETLNEIWFRKLDKKLNPQEINGKSSSDIIEIIYKLTISNYDIVRKNIIEKTSLEILQKMERNIIIRVFDDNWKIHIDYMAKSRSSSMLASYAQKNPFQVYVEEGTKHFEDFLKRISHNSTRLLMNNEYAFQDLNNNVINSDSVTVVKKNT